MANESQNKKGTWVAIAGGLGVAAVVAVLSFYGSKHDVAPGGEPAAVTQPAPVTGEVNPPPAAEAKENTEPPAPAGAPPKAPKAPAVVELTPAIDKTGGRTLEDDARMQLLRTLGNKKDPVTIDAQKGDPEAKLYAEQIQSFLRSQDYVGIEIKFKDLGDMKGIKIDGKQNLVKVGGK